MALFTYISKQQSDLTFSKGFYFHRSLHPRSFAKNKTLMKISEFIVYMAVDEGSGQYLAFQFY